MIPYNKPYLTGNEINYIKQVIESGKISGNGPFTKLCQRFFEDKYNFGKCLLTSSGTDALEMAAILLNIKDGDEIIMPSYTFVSTANAFVLRGAKIIFVDSRHDHPGIDEEAIEPLITHRTKAIVVVHYAGIACNMERILEIASNFNISIVEDAAHSIDSYYKTKPLGGMGHLAAFSFHETKNIISGEGGMLVINDKRYEERAEIIWEKGTNRASFWRGEVDKYGWMDVGSSFLPSEITAAFLLAQLEKIDSIQRKRKDIWIKYFNSLLPLQNKGLIKLPVVPSWAKGNGHLFYIVCKTYHERSQLIKYLKDNQIYAVFHYFSLHASPFYAAKHDGRKLKRSEIYSECLVRLPLYFELENFQITYISDCIIRFYENYSTKQVN